MGVRWLSPLTHSGSTQRPPGGRTLPAAPAPKAKKGTPSLEAKKGTLPVSATRGYGGTS